MHNLDSASKGGLDGYLTVAIGRFENPSQRKVHVTMGHVVYRNYCGTAWTEADVLVVMKAIEVFLTFALTSQASGLCCVMVLYSRADGHQC